MNRIVMITSNNSIIAFHFLSDNYNYTLIILSLLGAFKKIGGFFIFIVGGIVAIIVGSFMIRGTMHMWDNPDSDQKSDDND